MGLTIGNWVQLAVLLVGGTMAFANVYDGLGSLRQEVTRVEQHSRELEIRIRAVEVLQASQSSDLRNIQIGINEIKASLDRLAMERGRQP